MTTVVDRLREAIATIVRREVAELEFFGVYEYAVQATDGNASTPSKTVDANPTATATSGGRKLNLPNVTKVPIMLPYGVTPPVGALCTIEFLNGDPARPQVRSFNDPMTLMVFGGGTLPNARQGDMVLCGGPSTLVQFTGPAGPMATLTPYGMIFTTLGAVPPIPSPFLSGIVSSGRPTVKS